MLILGGGEGITIGLLQTKTSGNTQWLGVNGLWLIRIKAKEKVYDRYSQTVPIALLDVYKNVEQDDRYFMCEEMFLKLQKTTHFQPVDVACMTNFNGASVVLTTQCTFYIAANMTRS